MQLRVNSQLCVELVGHGLAYDQPAHGDPQPVVDNANRRPFGSLVRIMAIQGRATRAFFQPGCCFSVTVRSAPTGYSCSRLSDA
jgi:hypothetical protein